MCSQQSKCCPLTHTAVMGLTEAGLGDSAASHVHSPLRVLHLKDDIRICIGQNFPA